MSSVVLGSAQVLGKEMKNGRKSPLQNTYNVPSSGKANGSVCNPPHHPLRLTDCGLP